MSSEYEEYEKLKLRALLHDISKFWQGTCKEGTREELLKKIYNFDYEINETNLPYFRPLIEINYSKIIDLKESCIKEWYDELYYQHISNWKFFFEFEPTLEVKHGLIDFLYNNSEDFFISYFSNNYSNQNNQIKQYILEKLKNSKLSEIKIIIEAAFLGEWAEIIKIEKLIEEKINNYEVDFHLFCYIVRLIAKEILKLLIH